LLPPVLLLGLVRAAPPLRPLGDEGGLLQVQLSVDGRPVHAEHALGGASPEHSEQLGSYYRTLASIGDSHAALTAVPKVRLAEMQELQRVALGRGLEKAEESLRQLLLLLPTETREIAVRQASRNAAAQPVCVSAEPWVPEERWLPPRAWQLDPGRAAAAAASSSLELEPLFLQLAPDSNGTGPGSNATVGELFGAHEAPKRSPWLFYVNLLLVLGAFAFIILVIVYFSPLRGAGTVLRNEEGNVEVREWHCNKFAQVCLPFWVPVSEDTQGWFWLYVFAMSVVSGISLGFLYAMAKMRLALVCNPEVFSNYEGSSLRVDVFRSWEALVASVIGVFALPLQFLIFYKELKGRESQWLLLTIQLFLMFAATFASFFATFSSRTVTNWLVTRDADSYWHWQRTFVVAQSLISIFFAVLASYVGIKLRWNWKRYMTNYVLDRYMAKRSYYHLNSNSNKDDGADNPDARLCNDVPAMIAQVTGFAFSMLELVQGLITSLLLVWATIPFWTMFAVGYCMLGSAISMWFAWNFLRLNYETDRKNADFRFAMMNVRSMAEPIALYAGERAEREKINQRFESLQMYTFLSILWGVGFSVFENIYNLGLTTAPQVFVCMRYFRGEMDFGGIGQVTGGFHQLSSNLNYLHGHAESIAGMGNSVMRIAGLLRRIEEVEERSQLSFEFVDEPILELRDVRVCAPSGNVLLLSNVSFSLGRGGKLQRLLVCGRSGVGKSSLLRAVAGIWGRGGGTVVRPPDGDCMFLPQNPYMPTGNLRDQFRYPNVQAQVDPWEWYGREPGKTSEFNSKNHALDEDELMPLLEAVGLGDLPGRFPDGFDQNEDWNRVLSVGEQQRVSAVRCMLKRPKLAILDESTSALSELDEQLLYRRLLGLDIHYISVGHRSSLLNYHEVVLLIKSSKEYELMTPDQYMAHQKEELLAGASFDGGADKPVKL